MKVLILVCLVASVACHMVGQNGHGVHRHRVRPVVARANGGRHVQRVNTRVVVGGQHNAQSSNDKGDNQIVIIERPSVVRSPLYPNEAYNTHNHEGPMNNHAEEHIRIVEMNPFVYQQPPKQQFSLGNSGHMVYSSVDSFEQDDGIKSKRMATY
ncbi:unnamed protein product [Psylliodes chrysocephalus]|uniref:Uncharacterized protein n=1 Tax=Psylliodes chrysocephalus TaxID=3402493 RepID=A0A9P0CW40_9CUCU|nr:unnamed protein product [Psylliodes chrysocephala]